MSTMTVDGPGLRPGLGAAGPRSHAFVHARVMLRRNLRHLRRYPSLTLMIIGMPLVFLLLFVYIFGGTLGSGLGPGMPAGPAGIPGQPGQPVTGPTVRPRMTWQCADMTRTVEVNDEGGDPRACGRSHCRGRLGVP